MTSCHTAIMMELAYTAATLIMDTNASLTLHFTSKCLDGGCPLEQMSSCFLGVSVLQQKSNIWFYSGFSLYACEPSQNLHQKQLGMYGCNRKNGDPAILSCSGSIFFRLEKISNIRFFGVFFFRNLWNALAKSSDVSSTSTTQEGN